MPRPIVLGNGSVQVGINQFGLIEVFSFPYVGYENHCATHGEYQRIGVYIDDTMHWLDNGLWDVNFRYIDQALIGVVRAHNPTIGIGLELYMAVDAELPVYISSINIINAHSSKREITVYIQQNFVLGDTNLPDTIQALPDNHAIVQYKADRYVMVGGVTIHGEGFQQYAVGRYHSRTSSGTFRDAEDGQLSQNPVDHGRVDGVIGFMLSVNGNDSSRLEYWIATGSSMASVERVHRQMRKDGVLYHMLKTDQWWQKWLQRTLCAADRLPRNVRSHIIESMMIIKAHIDSHGGIVASSDSSILDHETDTYNYIWPRDATYALWPLIRLGYADEVLRFFDFCIQVMEPEGFLQQRYLPNGTVGSTWNPYFHNGITMPPIQEDETAIVVFMFARYYEVHKKRTDLETYYPSLVKPMASFLATYFDESRGLPKASYDIWEHDFQTTTYTTGLVYGALVGAARLAEIMQDPDSAVHWKSTADMIKQNRDTFFDQETSCVIKGFLADGTPDKTLDSASVYGAYMFGLYGVDSPQISSSISQIRTRLHCQAFPYGVMRFEGDDYRKSESSQQSNLWYVPSLWMAQYYFEKDQMDEGMKIIEWVTSQMSSTSMLAEQCGSVSGKPLSVSPFVWSQAEYVNCLLDTIPQEGSS